MSVKSLLEFIKDLMKGTPEQLYGLDRNQVTEICYGKVLEALKKFNSAKIRSENIWIIEVVCKKCNSPIKCIESGNYVYYQYNKKKYCINCWFKECFGVLKNAKSVTKENNSNTYDTKKELEEEKE